MSNCERKTIEPQTPKISRRKFLGWAAVSGGTLLGLGSGVKMELDSNQADNEAARASQERFPLPSSQEVKTAEQNSTTSDQRIVQAVENNDCQTAYQEAQSPARREAKTIATTKQNHDAYKEYLTTQLAEKNRLVDRINWAAYCTGLLGLVGGAAAILSEPFRKPQKQIDTEIKP